LRILGNHLPGGFADTVAVPVSSVHPVPGDLDLGLAVLAEPLAVAVHGVRLADPARGRNALVIGGGTIGLLTAFVATRLGWSVTIAVRHEHQRRAALALGVLRVVGGDRDSVTAAVGTEAPDVVFEAVGGRSDTLELALIAVRPGGAIVTLGLFAAPITLPPIRFLVKEVRLVGSMMYSRPHPTSDFAAAIGLLSSGRRELSELITHRVPLEDIERGFAAARDKRSGAIKVRVDVA
jgi:2-desacetyl-2-hydroxyethyl bacteriochlorophyllide A dehydrogenase